MLRWMETHALCHKHSSLQESDGACYAYKNDNCKGACLEEEPPEQYNARLEALNGVRDYPHNDFLMIDQGRKEGEKSFIYIENQCFKGYGFFELNHQIKTPEKIQHRMTPMEENSDCRALIQAHLKKNKYKKLIPLEVTEVNSN